MSEKAIPVADLEKLAQWHERRAKVKRINAEAEVERFDYGVLLGNADSHEVAAAVLRRVADGHPVEEL